MKTAYVALMFASASFLMAVPSAVAATPAGEAERSCAGTVDIECERGSDGNYCDVWIVVEDTCIDAVGPAVEMVDCIREAPKPFGMAECIIITSSG